MPDQSTTQTSGGGGGGGGGGGAGGSNPADALNMRASHQLFFVFIALVVAFGVYNLAISSLKHMRRLAAMNSDRQRYFSERNAFSDIKKELVYAPLVRHRHSRAFAFKNIQLGTVPSRLQTLLLVALTGVNIYLLVRDLPSIPLPDSDLSDLYNRAITLALTNAIPLLMLAGRKNILIMLWGIDFSIFNTFHRWIGRLVIAFVIIHAVCNIYDFASEGGAQAVYSTLFAGDFITYGFIAAICFVLLGISAAPYIRKAFYESFLFLHQALVATILVCIYIHTRGYWQNKLVIALIVTWAAERASRLVNLLINNVGRSSTRVMAEILPGDAMRVTIETARPMRVKPGSHVYLYLPTIGLWTSHPFSVAWTEKQGSYNVDSYELEKGGTVATSEITSSDNSLSLVVRKRSGVTSTLYKKAEKAGGRLFCRALVEGPYGGLHGLDSYGTVLMFAGGVGITHHVPQIRHLIAGYHNGTVACRKLLLVWAVQSSEHLEWVRPWMTSILAMDGRRDILRVMVFVTRPETSVGVDVQSPSASVQMFPGRRPDIKSIIDTEAVEQIGTMVLSVCGTGALSDDVRAHARRLQDISKVDLFDESFSW